MKKKTLAIVIALALIIGLGTGMTLAWLTDVSKKVENTFTAGNVKIKLEETKKVFKMVPGHTISKDPIVTVLGGSEKCYLFVKAVKGNDYDNFLDFPIDTAWTKLTGVDGVDDVWYQVVDANEADQAFHVLTNDQVTVKTTVTSEMIAALTGKNNPTLTFTAYASQYDKADGQNFTAQEAWNNVKDLQPKADN